MKKILKRCVGSAFLAMTLALGACQSPPPAGPAQAAVSSLSPRQVAVLREYGFEQVTEGWELQMAGKLLFDFNADKLVAAQSATVERMARALLSVDIDRLRVEGHTDDVGGDDYNERLSLRRAQAVAQVLTEVGIPQANISVHGYGHSRPLTHSDIQAGRRENRRVAIIVPVP